MTIKEKTQEVVKALDLHYEEGLSLEYNCNIYSFCNQVLIADFDFYNSRKIKPNFLFVFYRVENVVTWTKWEHIVFLDLGKSGFKRYINEVFNWRINHIKKENNL